MMYYDKFDFIGSSQVTEHYDKTTNVEYLIYITLCFTGSHYLVKMYTFYCLYIEIRPRAWQYRPKDVQNEYSIVTHGGYFPISVNELFVAWQKLYRRKNDMLFVQIAIYENQI